MIHHNQNPQYVVICNGQRLGAGRVALLSTCRCRKQERNEKYFSNTIIYIPGWQRIYFSGDSQVLKKKIRNTGFVFFPF